MSAPQPIGSNVDVQADLEVTSDGARAIYRTDADLDHDRARAIIRAPER